MTTEEIKEVRTCLAVCEQLIGQMPFMQVAKVMQGIGRSAMILDRTLSQKPEKEPVKEGDK
jgi:hypothetical protein